MRGHTDTLPQTDAELIREKRIAAFPKLRPFLWCPVYKNDPTDCHPHFEFTRHGLHHALPPYRPFVWSPTRPAPHRPSRRAGPLENCFPDGGGGYVIHDPPSMLPSQDFPNPAMEWGHPTLEAYLNAYERVDEYREDDRRRAEWAA